MRLSLAIRQDSRGGRPRSRDLHQRFLSVRLRDGPEFHLDRLRSAAHVYVGRSARATRRGYRGPSNPSPFGILRPEQVAQRAQTRRFARGRSSHRGPDPPCYLPCECIAEQVHALAAIADAVSPAEVHRVVESAIDRLGVVALAEELASGRGELGEEFREFLSKLVGPER
jgi:hypothetical protein